MSSTLLLPAKGVWISRLTEADSHPLDAHVEGVKALSDDAFRAVYLALVDDLVSFAFGMVSDRRTAEDIVQQAFVELVKAAPKIRGDGAALRAWLFRSVRFGCMDEYRRRSRRPEMPVDRLPDHADSASELDSQLDPALEQALNALTKRHRTVVLLRHVAGLSGEEIADVIGSTRRAAYAVLSRAEANLRDALGEGP